MKAYRKLLSVLSLLVLLCAMLFSTACSNSEDGDIPSGMQKIVSEVNDYNLYVPKDWTVDTLQGMTSVAIGDAAKSSVSVSAIVCRCILERSAGKIRRNLCQLDTGGRGDRNDAWRYKGI